VYNTTNTVYQSAPANPGASLAIILVYIVAIVVAIAATWKIYKKAGRPGWASIVPFYNLYVLLKIVGRPGWWLLLFLIPFVNVIVLIIVSIDMAKSFGKSTVFGVVGLFLFSFIGYLMLGFGSAQYVGPGGQAGGQDGQGGQPGGGSPAPAPSAPVAPANPVPPVGPPPQV
jgi:hypothetical protein